MISFIFLVLHYVFGLKYKNYKRKTRWIVNTYKKIPFCIMYHEIITVS